MRLPLVDPDTAVVGDARWLAVWTTTPWTLLSNTGVAVNPDLTYAVVDEILVADELVDAVMGEGASARVTTRVPGSSLVGLHYVRPFDDLDAPHGVDGWRVVPAGYVTTEEGTGLVHLAPAFGEVDRQIGRENGLPSLNPVGPDGRFTADIGWLAGRDVREANHDINDRLEAVGPADPPLPVRALVPALLAMPDSAHLLGQAQLVHRDLDAERRSPAPPTPPWTGIPATSGTAGSASGWRTTSTGRCRATASGARRSRSGAAAVATSAASARWPNCRTWPGGT